ncbi:hypothetical protein Tco_0312207 [Tanacetum coccineum]
MHRTKEEFVDVLGKISQFVSRVQGRLNEASSLVAQTNYDFLNKISEHAAEPLSIILQLKPEKLARSDNISASRNPRVSPPFAKESTPNKEWVNAMVDGPDYDVTGDADKDKPTEILVQRVSHAVDADDDLVMERSRRVSSYPSDIVVALFVGEKTDDPPSSFGVEEVAASPSRD